MQMDFINIQRSLVKIVLRLPAASTFDGRSSLLQGLPNVPLLRSEGSAQVDLNHIISGLDGLGRLTRDGGIRPVIVVVDNALSYFPEGSEVSDELQEIKALLEAYYGGELQLEPEQPVADATFEALVFGVQRDTRVDFAFIKQAHTLARSIARLTIPRVFSGTLDGKVVYGTGWIIAPGILMTNHHVIDARDRRPPPSGWGEQVAAEPDFQAQAERMLADFDYYNEADGSRLECRASKLLASSRELDYAIIELEQAEKIADRQPIRVVPEQPTLNRGARVNIVQHPRGGPLRFAIRNNFFVRPAERPAFVYYQTDTEPGASGSPVCNDDWQVVALHHASLEVPPEWVPQEVVDGKLAKVTVLNEAVQIHEVLNDLPPELKQRILTAN
jgi:V8-like Glu-specific endopeptidase